METRDRHESLRPNSETEAIVNAARFAMRNHAGNPRSFGPVKIHRWHEGADCFISAEKDTAHYYLLNSFSNLAFVMLLLRLYFIAENIVFKYIGSARNIETGNTDASSHFAFPIKDYSD